MNPGIGGDGKYRESSGEYGMSCTGAYAGIKGKCLTNFNVGEDDYWNKYIWMCGFHNYGTCSNVNETDSDIRIPEGSSISQQATQGMGQGVHDQSNTLMITNAM